MENRIVSPSALEAEKALIGSILSGKTIFSDVQTHVEPSDFQDILCNSIFEGMRSLKKVNRQIDEFSISELLSTSINPIPQGYLATCKLLAEEGTVDSFVDSIKHASYLRNTIRFSDEVQKMALQGISTESMIDYLVKYTTKSSKFTTTTYETSANLSLKSFDRLEKRCMGQHEPKFPSGLKALDEHIGGYYMGQVCYVAARPGMGKTSFLCQYIVEMSKHAPCMITTLELSADSMMDKLIAYHAKIPYRNYADGDLSHEHYENLSLTSQWLQQSKVIIDGRSTTISSVESNIRKAHREHGIKFVAIDYIQRIRSTLKHNSRDEELGFISNTLAELAKSLNINILILAQLNRKVEDREDKRPQMSDIRESGNVEQDAFVVMLLFREAYYKAEGVDPEQAEIIIAKNRNGKMGDTAHVRFIPETTNFTNY